ncbi:MAG: DUF502 domain-containing protein [Haloferacaceae archaeon]
MSLAGRLRTSFVAGAVLVAPLAITLFVLQFVFLRVSRALDPVVRATRLAAYTANSRLLAQALAAVLLAAGVTALGYVASRSVGRRLFGSLERGVRLVPFVRTVYFGVRGVSESLLERAGGYERVVLVEFPRSGCYSVGFVTNRAPAAARTAAAAVAGGADAGEDLYAVFLPHSPNPTAGRLVLLPDGDLTELDMSVRGGLRLLITTGLSVDAVEEELVEGGGTGKPGRTGEAGIGRGEGSDGG